MNETYGTTDASGYMPANDNWQWGAQAWEPPKPPQEDPKTTRKHFSKLGWMFTAGAVIIYAVQLAPMLLVSYVRPEWLEDANIGLMLAVLPMYLIGMPALIALVRLVPGKALERRQMPAGKFAVSVIMCFALVYIFNMLGSLITVLIGLLKGSLVDNEVANMTASVSMWLILFYMVLCAPIMEELVFRKMIVERTIRYGQGVAVLVSGLMFGLFHGNLNQFAYAFMLGMFLAFLYVKTGNIKITIALHMMINFMGGFVTTGLSRALDLDEYILAMSTRDMVVITSYLRDHAVMLALYLLLGIFVIGTTIAGGILIIVSIVKNKFTFARGEVMIPKGKRFATVFLNAGMICYSIFWIGMIILQLLK